MVPIPPDDIPPPPDDTPDELPPIVCPHCGQTYPWDSALIGRKVECHNCDLPFRIAGDGETMAADDYELSADPDQPDSADEAAPRVIVFGDDAPADENAPAPVAATGSVANICPQCGQAMQPFATICDACGYDGTLTGTHSSRFERDAIRKPPPPPELRDIFAAPFRSDAIAEAFTLSVVVAGWAVVVLGLYFLAWLFLAVCMPVGIVVTLVFGALMVAIPGWVAQRYMGIAEQYEQASLMSSPEVSKLHALALMMLHTAVASPPVALAFAASAQLGVPWLSVLIMIGGFVVAAGYWFMAIAMAGAHGTWNPLSVVAMISHQWGFYRWILLYAVPIATIAAGLGFMLALWAQWYQPNMAGQLMRWILPLPFLQYPLLSAVAMVATLLRRQRLGGDPIEGERRRAMPMVLGACGGAVFVMLLTGGAWSAWTHSLKAAPAVPGIAGQTATAAAFDAAVARVMPPQPDPVDPPDAAALADLDPFRNLRVTNAVPARISRPRTRGFIRVSEESAQSLVEGEADVAAAGVIPVGQPAADPDALIIQLDQPPPLIWVQMPLTIAQLTQGLGGLSTLTARYQRIILVDETGKTYAPSAWFITRADGTMSFNVDPTTSFLEADELPLDDLTPGDTLNLYFLVPKRTTLHEVRIGEDRLAIEPPKTVE